MGFIHIFKNNQAKNQTKKCKRKQNIKIKKALQKIDARARETNITKKQLAIKDHTPKNTNKNLERRRRS